MVRQVPPGKVVSYGLVAFWLGWNHGARTVGWAMRGCPQDVPWQRVVNSKGQLSVGDKETQRALLEMEGVRFTRGDNINPQGIPVARSTGDTG